MKFALPFSVALFNEGTPTRGGLASIQGLAWFGLGNAGTWSLASHGVLSWATAATTGALRKPRRRSASWPRGAGATLSRSTSGPSLPRSCGAKSLRGPTLGRPGGSSRTRRIPLTRWGRAYWSVSTWSGWAVRWRAAFPGSRPGSYGACGHISLGSYCVCNAWFGGTRGRLSRSSRGNA
jgi:hypothetical protein